MALRMHSVRFRDLVDLCHALEGTSSKLEKCALIGRLIKSLPVEAIRPFVLLLLGKIFPAGDPRSLDISGRTLQNVIESLPPPPAESTVSLMDVYGSLERIAETHGAGSRQRKEAQLRELYEKLTHPERRILTKMIIGEMQHGVAEGVMLQAIAEAVGADMQTVQRAAQVLGDVSDVAVIGLTQGAEALRHATVRLMRPLQPMLASLADSVEQALQEHGGQTAFEYKYDGARVQIHIGPEDSSGKAVRIYSRHLAEVTASLPEVVLWAQQRLAVDSAIVEGEVVAVNEEGRPLPFQELMRRFRRVHAVRRAQKEVPVRLFLFDVLFLNGESLLDVPYAERWARLEAIAPVDLLASRLVTGSADEARAFLERAMAEGHEGLMAKDLQSLYQPGSRGKKWFKIKPAETLDLVIVAADWGYGRRTGWLSNYHLAARDRESGEFAVIGKTFKGLTDAEFQWMTERLLELSVGAEGSTVYVRPEVVVEVAYNEIQRSPQYRSGFALRFARITRIRHDKSPDQIDTLDRIRELYERQFERKGRK